MFRVGLLAQLLVLSLAMNVHAQAEPFDLSAPVACPAFTEDLTIAPVERAAWTDCEKWVWSCVRQGLEANLFSKQCLRRGTTEHSEARKKWRMAPFFDPDQYAATNTVRERFLETVLTNPAYRDLIPAMGLRVFGAYFAEPVNLENMAVKTNLVLDGSMMKRGLRLTNFNSERNLSLDGSNIRGSLYLMRARIAGSIYMEFGAYDTVDLRDARIGASFEGTSSIYNSELRFDRAHVEGKIVLSKARLTMLRGDFMKVGGEFDMRIADIRLGMNLSGAAITGDVRLPEITFGRRRKTSPVYCDWVPDRETDDLLNRVAKVEAKPEVVEAALHEVVGSRPMYGGREPRNFCEKVDEAGAMSELSTVLLRNMRIDGTLCLVDISGEITTLSHGNTPSAITTISLDGTTAKSTILRWKDSKSQTVWHAVNFKTGHLLVNLENQPQVNYFDNIDIGAVTFLTKDATDQIASLKGSETEMDLLKTKCDVTPVQSNTQEIDNAAAQNQIITFFANNTSLSIQPFTNFVSKLEATGLDTTRLKIGLSELQFRNSCSSSRLTVAWRNNPWSGFRAEAGEAKLQDYYRLSMDLLCAAGYTGYKYTVSYGHRPLNLVLWAIALVLVLYFALWFDRKDPAAPGAPRHMGMLYVIDNLIPVKHYRFDHAKAARDPNSSWLKAHVKLHRGLGVALAILAFFFIYRASK